MNTTYILIELLISGFLFFVSLFPFAIFFFGCDLESVLKFHLSIHWPFQVLFAYSAGIVWNRICDEIYSHFEKVLILSKFDSKEDYISARLKIILHGAPVKDYLETLRSLLRVSRVFSITLIIYTVSVPIYLFLHNFLSISQNLLIIISLALFTFTTIYAWYKFQRSYVIVIYDTYEHIIEDEKRETKLRIMEEKEHDA